MKILFLMVAIIFISTTAIYAQQIRVVVLPKVTIENKENNSSSLESLITKSLNEKGMRVVELSAALAAQKAAFSDTVQSGKLPSELSVLNADALASIQLICDKNSGAVLGSDIQSYFCTMNSKIIRIDSGDVAYTESKNYTAIGLNALQAVETLLKKQLYPELAANIATWQKSWGGDGKWSLDIVVTGLADRKKAQEISDYLGKVKGVESCSLVMFTKDFSKYAISGSDAPNLKNLKAMLDTDSKLSLKVNYESGRLVHAEFDFGQAFSRGINVYLEMKKTANAKTFDLISSNGAGLLHSYLMNMDYFDVKTAELTQKDKGSLVQEAKKSGIPLVLLSSITNDGSTWLNTMELIGAKDGKTIVAASGNDSDPFAAMDKSVRDMDKKYRLSLANPATRLALNFSNDAKAAAQTERLSVEQFDVAQIFPSLLPYYRKNGIGTMTIKNISGKKLDSLEIRYSINDKVAGTMKLAELAAGKTEKINVKLDIIPDGASGAYSQIVAEVTYKDGETYGRKDAFSPLVLHKRNTINWADPKTLAAFVDSENKAVRDIATKAIAEGSPSGMLTKQLAKASMVFSGLWHQPLKYVTDPVTTGFSSDIDTVQYPGETLGRLAGDCDDLTVLLSSLYESLGLATVVITTPGHVFLGVESGTLAGGHWLFNLPESMFIKVDGALFVPVEATAIGSSFAESWIKAADILNKSRKEAHAYRVREAWKTYPTYAVKEEKNNLSLVKPDLTALQKTLDLVRASVKNDSPAWAKIVNENLIGNKSVKIADSDMSKYPLAATIVNWLAGARDKAIQSSGELCQKDVVEACYNMTVMTMYDALEQNDVNIVQMNMEKQNYSEAVAVLPANVVSMLLDNGGAGMGDEASKESETKKKLAEILKSARAKIAEKKSKGGLNIQTSHVGGRKGAETGGANKATAEMFFWDKVN